MRYYPLLLNTHGQSCLIVGVGDVGQRKLADILTSDIATVLVLDRFSLSDMPSSLLTLLDDPRVRYEQRDVAKEDIEAATLVFATTNNPTLNTHIACLCQQHNVLCNIADNPTAGSFIVPAKACRGRVTLAISTQAASPALAKRLREDLETWLETKHAPLAEFMARIRPLVLDLNLGTTYNTTLFRALVTSSFGDALGAKDREQCERLAKELLPEVLQTHLAELLHGLV